MNLLIFLLIGVLIYRRICYLHEKNISLEFRNTIFPIRDRLRFYSIQGKLKIEDPIFIKMEQLVTNLAEDSEKFNIYYFAILFALKHKPTDEEYEEYDKTFLIPVMENKYYKEAYIGIRNNFFRLLHKKHFLLMVIYWLKNIIRKNFEDLRRAIEYRAFNSEAELIPNYHFTN